jgi:predicted DNA-binding transcriptional regulator AlpA
MATEVTRLMQISLGAKRNRIETMSRLFLGDTFPNPESLDSNLSGFWEESGSEDKSSAIEILFSLHKAEVEEEAVKSDSYFFNLVEPEVTRSIKSKLGRVSVLTAREQSSTATVLGEVEQFEQDALLFHELLKQNTNEARQILPVLQKVVELLLQYSHTSTTITESLDVWLAQQILHIAQPNSTEAARAEASDEKQKLLEAEGGCVTVSEAAKLLGISRQAIDKRRANGSLLAVTHHRRGYLYPKWQFSLAGIDQVLEKLSDEGSWTKMIFLLSPTARFSGSSPLDYLRQGRVEEVLAHAETWGDTTAL